MSSYGNSLVHFHFNLFFFLFDNHREQGTISSSCPSFSSSHLTCSSLLLSSSSKSIQWALFTLLASFSFLKQINKHRNLTYGHRAAHHWLIIFRSIEKEGKKESMYLYPIMFHQDEKHKAVKRFSVRMVDQRKMPLLLRRVVHWRSKFSSRLIVLSSRQEDRSFSYWILWDDEKCYLSSDWVLMNLIIHVVCRVCWYCITMMIITVRWSTSKFNGSVCGQQKEKRDIQDERNDKTICLIASTVHSSWLSAESECFHTGAHTHLFSL